MRRVTRELLAEIVGPMAALMVYGEGGAAIGRSYLLRDVRSGRRVQVAVTRRGAWIGAPGEARPRETK